MGDNDGVAMTICDVYGTTANGKHQNIPLGHATIISRRGWVPGAVGVPKIITSLPVCRVPRKHIESLHGMF